MMLTTTGFPRKPTNPNLKAKCCLDRVTFGNGVRVPDTGDNATHVHKSGCDDSTSTSNTTVEDVDGRRYNVKSSIEKSSHMQTISLPNDIRSQLMKRNFEVLLRKRGPSIPVKSSAFTGTSGGNYSVSAALDNGNPKDTMNIREREAARARMSKWLRDSRLEHRAPQYAIIRAIIGNEVDIHEVCRSPDYHPAVV